MPAKKTNPLKFPKHFMWGAASSAHQYEGGMDNQWSDWETQNAKSLATQSRYQYNDLESWSFSESQASDPKSYISGRANNHRELYKLDFKVLEMMNLNAWRFGIEWARVEPTEGQWSQSALDYYQEYIEELKRRGIEPVVTLFHFSLPRWFSDKGGFEKRANVQYFERYARKIIDLLSKLKVRYIITINEPDVYVAASYVTGEWPPNKRKLLTAVKVQRHFALAHKRIASHAHQHDRRLKLAVAKNSSYFRAKNDKVLTRVSTKVMQYFQDDYFLKSYVRHSDFIGVNYYFSNQVEGRKVNNNNEKVSDLGWDMKPRDIQLVLERLSKKYNKPLFITENGLADATDQYRKWWIQETILGMNAAMKSGVQLLGYLHWSLLDNFEWNKGFWPRFGLIEVDYKTMKRKPRPSALWYAKIVKQLRGL